MGERQKKDIVITPGSTTIGTADIVALGAVLISVLLALGIVFHAIGAKEGALVIVPLLGAAGVAQIVKAKQSKSK